MIGQYLAHYKITAKLGEGGMGEVWRATDTKLGREVALKILPEIYARDPERLARFDREAKVLASLNHPNIAAIYGMEERALVMELVEGETLKGPVPPETALQYARQITDAMDAAHEKGITHRDLKPANVKVTPEGVIKVLDFGLAKLAEETIAGDPENSPTLTAMATRMGTLMGTPSYMAPEQARAQVVDKRADIWSFGVIVFELLSGNRLFAGETISDTLAQVLTKDPDWTQLPPGTPPQLERLLRRCLEKDRRKRLRDIGEAWTPEETKNVITVEAPAKRPVPWMVAAGLFALAAVAAGFMAWRAAQPVELSLERVDAELDPPLEMRTGTGLILSPDGKRLAYVASGGQGPPHLWTRRLDQPKPVRLDGTSGASHPFFSPDSKWIAFGAEGKLKKISVDGGAALTLCDAAQLRGGSWGEDGNIIAALEVNSGLMRVPAAGGAPSPVTKFDAARKETRHRWPQILPGGGAVLFTSHTSGGNYDEAHVDVWSLADGKRKNVHRGASWARYLPTGHLIFLHQSTLFAVPFDLERLEKRGTPAPVLEDVAFLQGALLDTSAAGGLIYVNGRQSVDQSTIQWLDKEGKTLPLRAAPAAYSYPRFSPDGKRLAVNIGDAGNSDIWVYEWERDTMSRLTFGAEPEYASIWSPKGTYIYYSVVGQGLFRLKADGSGKPEKVLGSNAITRSHSFSPDGKWLAYMEVAGGRPDLWTVALDADGAEAKAGKPQAFLKTPFVEVDAMFSPDGKWLAYASNESGRYEIYVRPFPDTGGKWMVSNGGGSDPVWSRNGREIYFHGGDSRLMVSTYAAKGGAFAASKPEVWSSRQLTSMGVANFYDLSPDGKRFAVADRMAGEERPAKVAFLFHFFDELKRRVPVE
jgi:serine/threonine-protein kinase